MKNSGHLTLHGASIVPWSSQDMATLGCHVCRASTAQHINSTGLAQKSTAPPHDMATLGCHVCRASTAQHINSTGLAQESTEPPMTWRPMVAKSSRNSRVALHFLKLSAPVLLYVLHWIFCRLQHIKWVVRQDTPTQSSTTDDLCLDERLEQFRIILTGLFGPFFGESYSQASIRSRRIGRAQFQAQWRFQSK